MLDFVGFKRGLLEAGTETFTDATYMTNLFHGNEADVEYDLMGKYRQVSFTAAISNSAPPVAHALVQVFVDGGSGPLATTSVNWGKPKHLKVGITGKIQLEIKVTALSSNVDDHGFDVGWADGSVK